MERQNSKNQNQKHPKRSKTRSLSNLKIPNQVRMAVMHSLRFLKELGRAGRVVVQKEAVETQLEEEEVTTVEEEEVVKTAAMEVRAVVEVAEAVEETERVAVENVDQEVNMVVQVEAVEAVVPVRETKVLKKVKEPLLTPLKQVASEKDTLVKLVKSIIQWIANQELAAEREITRKAVLEKVTGVTIKVKSKLLQVKKKKRRL